MAQVATPKYVGFLAGMNDFADPGATKKLTRKTQAEISQLSPIRDKVELGRIYRQLSAALARKAKTS